MIYVLICLYHYIHISLKIYLFFLAETEKGQSEFACMEILQIFKSKYSKEATIIVFVNQAGELVGPVAGGSANSTTALLPCPKFIGLV